MSTSRNSDNHWERYGKIDPYFGVLSDEKYKSENIDEKAREAFFASGEEHIDHVLGHIRLHLATDFHPRKALDFGCGVGRLVIPLSKVVEEVVGIDISSSMIVEARKNCQNRAITNAHFASSASELSTKFDLIHSFIVFQHIPVAKGERIFKCLINRLSPGGVGVLHFTYHAPKYARLVHWVLRNIPFACHLYNLLIGRSLTYPIMQSNFYNLNSLFCILQLEKCSNASMEFTQHKRNSGIILYFQKDAE